jgi:hypothetical protein
LSESSSKSESDHSSSASDFTRAIGVELGTIERRRACRVTLPAVAVAVAAVEKRRENGREAGPGRNPHFEFEKASSILIYFGPQFRPKRYGYRAQLRKYIGPLGRE